MAPHYRTENESEGQMWGQCAMFYLPSMYGILVQHVRKCTVPFALALSLRRYMLPRTKSRGRLTAAAMGAECENARLPILR